jgi:HSP20 family protein
MFQTLHYCYENIEEESFMSYQSWPSLVNQFQSEVGKLFERSFPTAEGDASKIATAQWTPSVDIKEEANRFVIRADIPGVNPKDIHVSMENGILTIRGERQHEKEEKSENYFRTECARGVFYRHFSLPESADAENISAKGKHGVLDIIIPKRPKDQARKVDVRVEE